MTCIGQHLINQDLGPNRIVISNTKTSADVHCITHVSRAVRGGNLELCQCPCYDVPDVARKRLTLSPGREQCSVAQQCPALCGLWTAVCQASLAMEFFQARTLESGAISYSREQSGPKGQNHISFIFCIGRQIENSSLLKQRHQVFSAFESN